MLYVVGDSSVLVVLEAIPLLGLQVLPEASDPGSWTQYSLTQPVAAPVTDVPRTDVLPDLYEYLPTIVRNLDQELVASDGTPTIRWDDDLSWDQTPYTWDDLMGPEPILRTTFRPVQIELERIARAIEDLTTLVSLQEAPESLLPYLGSQLGAIPPEGSGRLQRAFLDRLVENYRRKGTLLSFQSLFSALGFDVLLRERFQRATDGALVQGPQARIVRTEKVVGEPQGLVSGSVGPYPVRLAYAPVARGSVRLRVPSLGGPAPLVISDDGSGSWAGMVLGTFDYSTGVGSFTLPSPPLQSGRPILADYTQIPDPFPDPLGNRWRNQWRSSTLQVVLTPREVNLTSDLADRITAYIDLLKPAHVTLADLSILLQLSDDWVPTDDLDPRLSLLHVELPWGTLYYGHGYQSTLNASLDPADGTTLLHRDQGEFVTSPGRVVPDVYPFYYDGTFVQPHGQTDPNYPAVNSTVTFEDNPDSIRSTSGTNWGNHFVVGQWINVTGALAVAGVNNRLYRISGFSTTSTTQDTILVHSSTPVPTDEATVAVTVTRDDFFEYHPGGIVIQSNKILEVYESVVSSVTSATVITISKNGITRLGVGDKIVFTSGVNQGMWAILTVLTSSTGTYLVEYSIPSDFASYWGTPSVGDTISLLDVAGVDHNGLKRREVDRLDIDLLQTVAASGSTTAFSFTLELANADAEIVPGSVTLSYTESTPKTEADNGLGAFTTANGDLLSGTIDYTDGDVSLTWTNAPDSPNFTLRYRTTTTAGVGF